ncbi:MAG: hypothetical protein JRE63_03475 [Deltaproteobacteria bacterium]|nr:hypothetical protein [Deltaproteobacteria bacterium]
MLLKSQTQFFGRLQTAGGRFLPGFGQNPAARIGNRFCQVSLSFGFDVRRVLFDCLSASLNPGFGALPKLLDARFGLTLQGSLEFSLTH